MRMLDRAPLTGVGWVSCVWGCVPRLWQQFTFKGIENS